LQRKRKGNEGQAVFWTKLRDTVSIEVEKAYGKTINREVPYESSSS